MEPKFRYRNALGSASSYAYRPDTCRFAANVKILSRSIFEENSPLFEEKKRKKVQIQLFCNRFSVLGQAPRKVIKTVTTSLVIRLFINFLGILRTCAGIVFSISGFGFNS